MNTITANELLKTLWQLAPAELKQDWDNVGLLCGSGEARTARVLLALDPTVEVAQEAAALGCRVVVTHHPVTFGCKSVTDESDTGRRMLAYLQNGLALIALHTNLDSAPGGVNDALAACLGLTQCGALADDGIGRTGLVPAQSLHSFVRFVKDALHCPGLRYADGGRTVHRVAVGGGSCAELLDRALALGCDTFVTADVKYHQFCTARERGLNLLDAGHFETENPVCAALQAQLQRLLPEIDFILAKNHADCTQFAE